MSSSHTTEKGAGSLFSLNDRAAQAFVEIAEYLELQGENPFKIKAYVKAASVLRQLEDDLEELAEAKSLQSIPGVGKAIAEKLEAFLTTGTIPQLEELRAQIPPGLVAVSGLPGLGPKKTAQLNKELGIGDLADLRQALIDEKVAPLKGFTAKSQQKLLDEVDRAISRVPTFIKGRLEEWAEQTRDRLAGLDGVTSVELVGEVRRKSPEAGALELLLVSRDPASTLADLSSRLRDEAVLYVEDEIETGDGTPLPVLTLAHPSGCPMRLTICDQLSSAWNKLWLTGPREFADHVGLKLEGTPWEGSDEGELLGTLNLEHLVPEVRHRKELWEQKGGVDLLSLVQIQGNLHGHSTDSDGTSSIEEMVAEARKRGHAYYGVTDHSRSLVIANGLSSERLLQQNAHVRALDDGFGDFTLLSSTECDILEDGTLDYPAEVLDKLDYVVIAVHSFFHHDVLTMTERIMAAISAHPKVKILAHPTGRLLTRRDGYQADWARVFELAAERDVAIEINSNPWRLDVSEELLDMALRAGCYIAINTDCHSLREFENARHGVDMARRGVVPPERVINTWPVERLKAWFRSSVD